MTTNDIIIAINKAKALLISKRFEDLILANEIIDNMGAELGWGGDQINYFTCHFKKEPDWYPIGKDFSNLVTFDYEMRKNK